MFIVYKQRKLLVTCKRKRLETQHRNSDEHKHKFSSAHIISGIVIIFNSWQREDSSLLHSFQIGSGAHPASYLMGTGAAEVVVPRSGMVELYFHSPILLHVMVLN
jgi:hypothetical protein